MNDTAYDGLLFPPAALSAWSFIQGLFLFGVINLSFLIQVNEYFARVMLVTVPGLISFYLSFPSKGEKFHPTNMFFAYITDLACCAFVEYTISYTSLKRILHMVEEKRKQYKGFVNERKERKKKTKPKNVKNSEVRPVIEEKQEIKVEVPDFPVEKEFTMKVPKDEQIGQMVPPDQLATMYREKEQAKEAAEKAVEKQLDSDRELGELDSDEERQIEMEAFEEFPRDLDSLFDEIENPRTAGSDESDYSQQSSSDVSLTEELKDIDEELKKDMEEHLNFFVGVSQLPADVTARKTFPIAFSIFMVFFTLVYLF